MALPNPYLPSVPSLVSEAFSAAKPQESFDRLSKWSLKVGDYNSGAGNILNLPEFAMTAAPFRPGSLSRVWTSGSSDPQSYVGFTPGTGAIPWNLYGVRGYDIPGASINFYLREMVPENGLRINSTVSFWKAREQSFTTTNNCLTANFTFTLSGYLDGITTNLSTHVLNPQYKYGILVAAVLGSFTRRGFNLTFSATNSTPLSAGLHTFRLHLGQTINKTTSSVYLDKFLMNHIKGSGARTTVTAIYK